MFVAFKIRLHLFLLRIYSFCKEIKRWHFHKRGGGGCKVYYGHDHIPGSSENASGGIIKCQDLQVVFPNSFNDANILYLVSSSLPLFPQYLLRYAMKNGVKLVWNQNGVAYPAWHGPGWEKTNKIPAKWLHKADHVMYQSEFCKKSADKYLGKFNGRYSILYNPVDTEMFVPAPLRLDGFKILIAGTHNEKYRIESALRVFGQVARKLAEAEFIVAGPLCWQKDLDSALSEFDEMARQFGVDKKMTVVGAYSQQEAVSLFQSAHLLLHTQYNDACPRLVVEAMACGLPVVYSASGGTPELVGSKAGIGIDAPLDWEHIHPPDPGCMAQAILDIHERYDTYSTEARKRAVKYFDLQDWLDRHREIFAEVLQ